MSYKNKIAISFSILFFIINIFAAESQISKLKAMVDSGKLTPAEAIKEAKDSNITERQIKEYSKQQENSNLQSKESLQKKKESNNGTIANTVQEALPESDPKPVLSQEKEKDRQNYFGYDLFRGSPDKFRAVKEGPVDPNYQLGSGDEIILSLWGDTEFRSTYTISREGTIYIDNIGQIIVNGLTVISLQNKLLKTMSKVYNSLNPTSGKATTFIDVSLGKLKPISVFFVGKLKKPGAYQVDSYSTAFTALYEIGGPSIEGSLRNIQIIRNGKIIATFDLYDYILTGKKIKDIRLQNDDTIFIPPRLNTITLSGEILTPAIFEIKESENLNDLIKFSGGLKTKADINRVQIERIIPFAQRTLDNSKYKIIDNALTTLENNKIKIRDIKLFDRDKIKIYQLIDPLNNYVYVKGAVFRPGKYALDKNLNISALINKAEGFLPEAYLKKADLKRTYLDLESEYFSLDLTTEKGLKFKLTDYDTLKIYSKWELKQKEYVNISGHVFRPGKYNLDDSLRISDLLFKAGGLNDPYFKKQTYLKRADLIRYNDDQLTTYIIPIKLDSLLDGNIEQNLLLKHRDNLRIYNIDVIFKPETVSIKGKVKTGGEFKLQTNMKLHDLILRAGGFTKDAYQCTATVYRVNPYSISDDTLAIAHRISLNPDSLNNFSKKDDFILQDKDLVIIREHPDFQYQRNITISGEVKFPGTYSLLKKRETLREIITRAGGLKKESFIAGMQFTRFDKKMVGDYEKNFEENSFFDIELKAGDKIFIPKHPGFVTVKGVVNNPGMVKFHEGWSLDNYIEAAGGIQINTEDWQIIVYYPSGNAKEDGIIFSPEVYEGSRIVVHQKIDKEEPADWTSVFKNWASIAASLATVIYIIDKN